MAQLASISLGPVTGASNRSISGARAFPFQAPASCPTINGAFHRTMLFASSSNLTNTSACCNGPRGARYRIQLMFDRTWNEVNAPVGLNRSPIALAPQPLD